MTEADFKEFSRVWFHLCEVFGKPKPHEITMKLIFNALSPFDIEQVKNAAGLYVRTEKFMPRPADLAELIHGTRDERARVAFLIALQATESVKSYQSIKFDDKTTQEVVFALGGWSEFCHGLKENRSLTENRFLKWHIAAQSIDQKRAPEVLLGIDRQSKSYVKVGANDVVIRSLP